MTRSSVIGAAVVSVLLIACDAGEAKLGSLPEAAPADVEPGYVFLLTLSKWRPPRVVPGCGRSALRTSWSPAIEILSSGGIGGSGTGNVQIWEDGSVLFDAAGCPNGMGRRGKLSRARVRDIIDTLEEARFFTWSCQVEIHCHDSFITSLTVQRGSDINTVVDAGCSDKPTLAAQAIELVLHAVGKNACVP